MREKNPFLVFDALRNILGVFGKEIYLDFLELKGTFKNSVIVTSSDRQIKIPNLNGFDVDTAIFPWHVTSKEVFEKEKLYNPYSSLTTSRPTDRINNFFPYITEVDTKNIKCLGFDNPFVQILNNPNEAAFDNMEVCCFNEVFKAEWENLKKRIVKHSDEGSATQLIKKINDFWNVLSDIDKIESPNSTCFDVSMAGSPFAISKEINGSIVRGVQTRSYDVFAKIVHHLQADVKLVKFLCEQCALYGFDKLINDRRFSEYVEYWRNEPGPGVPVRYSIDKTNEMRENYIVFSEELYRVFNNMYRGKKLKENLLEAAKNYYKDVVEIEKKSGAEKEPVLADRKQGTKAITINSIPIEQVDVKCLDDSKKYRRVSFRSAYDKLKDPRIKGKDPTKTILKRINTGAIYGTNVMRIKLTDSKLDNKYCAMNKKFYQSLFSS